MEKRAEPVARKKQAVQIEHYGIWIELEEGHSTYHPISGRLVVSYPSLNITVTLPLEKLLEAIEEVSFKEATKV